MRSHVEVGILIADLSLLKANYAREKKLDYLLFAELFGVPSFSKMRSQKRRRKSSQIKISKLETKYTCIYVFYVFHSAHPTDGPSL